MRSRSSWESWSSSSCSPLTAGERAVAAVVPLLLLSSWLARTPSRRPAASMVGRGVFWKCGRCLVLLMGAGRRRAARNKMLLLCCSAAVPRCLGMPVSRVLGCCSWFATSACHCCDGGCDGRAIACSAPAAAAGAVGRPSAASAVVNLNDRSVIGRSGLSSSLLQLRSATDVTAGNQASKHARARDHTHHPPAWPALMPLPGAPGTTRTDGTATQGCMDLCSTQARQARATWCAHKCM